ncbi:hypothetical protein SMD44_00561 [Streptomyces alboflavus]|uniref:Uncharacterized protein n=1 Tax=Streptomyces alboflavus TaxID=67267 RepID=A0A1Z1W413_9ACTN|nr:hypothetical protein SMD44_00561 [Streptomyces alboflavus]
MRAVVEPQHAAEDERARRGGQELGEEVGQGRQGRGGHDGLAQDPQIAVGRASGGVAGVVGRGRARRQGGAGRHRVVGGRGFVEQQSALEQLINR